MTEVDSITRLLDIGFNAVLLFLLWRVYQDFMKFIERHITYLEKLTSQLLPTDETPSAPVYRPQSQNNPWETRTPTSLGEDRRASFQPAP